MLRFLRLYKQWILAVGGTLLLITFLMPQAISALSRANAQYGSTWATYGPDGKKVTVAELDSVRRELRVVEQLNNPLIQTLKADRDPVTWFLLTREAEDAGLVGSAGDGRTSLNSMAAANGVAPEVALGMLASKSQTDGDTVLRTLAKLNGVTRLVSLVGNMPRVSDTRLRQIAAESTLGVAADVVVLDARTLKTPDVPAPTDDELAQQLAAFGTVKSGTGDRGFGYRLPDRLKLEWIEIPADAVRTAIEQSGALDTLTLKKRFAADPAKYGADPASNPQFSAYEDTVRSKVLAEMVAERMAEIAKFASDQLALAQRGLKRDGAYLILPEDWDTRSPDLQAIASAIATQFELPYPQYSSTGATWIAVTDVPTLSGLSTSSTTRFGTAMRPRQLLEKLREFGSGVDTIPMQARVASPPLTAPNGDLTFFRVIDVDPSREPASIDEVRAELAQDVQSIDRYDELVKEIPSIEAEANKDGLQAVASKFGTNVTYVPNLRVVDPRFLAMGLRAGGSIPGLKNSAGVEALVDRALALPIDRPVSEIPAEERTFVIPLPDALAVVVARVTDLFPLTKEDFEPIMASRTAQSQLVGENVAQDIQDTFSLEALRARHNFHVSREKEGDGEEGGSAPETANASRGATAPAS